MRILASLGLLACLAAAPAFADDSAAPPAPPSGKFCDKNPDKCKEMKEKHDAFCAKNPETCKAHQEQRAQRQQWCKDNADECQKMKDERQQRMKDRQQKCKDNPDQCQKMRNDRRQMWRDRHGGPHGDSGSKDSGDSDTSK